MAQLAADIEEIDAEILRLHQHSVDPDTEELAALLDLCQIDELLERRHRLWPAEVSFDSKRDPKDQEEPAGSAP